MMVVRTVATLALLTHICPYLYKLTYPNILSALLSSSSFQDASQLMSHKELLLKDLPGFYPISHHALCPCFNVLKF